tara:strand:+ start:105 stop:680 length:576 start_codon:yes stop_codon:yes gene_type:complete
MGSIDEEIRKIIYATFSNSITSDLPYDELVRIWTLDMQWMGPEIAPQIIEKLCETGWLTNSDGIISPNRNVMPLAPPFGWSPIIRGLLNPPELVVKPAEKPRILIPESDVKSHIEVVASQKYPPDWAEASIKPMIALISEESGLPMKEVVRRAQRKRRALGPVTLWMALSLVAREQGLNMSKIAELIGNPN